MRDRATLLKRAEDIADSLTGSLTGLGVGAARNAAIRAATAPEGRRLDAATRGVASAAGGWAGWELAGPLARLVPGRGFGPGAARFAIRLPAAFAGSKLVDKAYDHLSPPHPDAQSGGRLAHVRGVGRKAGVMAGDLAGATGGALLGSKLTGGHKPTMLGLGLAGSIAGNLLARNLVTRGEEKKAAGFMDIASDAPPPVVSPKPNHFPKWEGPDWRNPKNTLDLDREDKLIRFNNRMNRPSTLAAAVGVPAAVGGLAGGLIGGDAQAKRWGVTGAGAGLGAYGGEMVGRMLSAEKPWLRALLAAGGSLAGGYVGHRAAEDTIERRPGDEPWFRKLFPKKAATARGVIGRVRRQLPTVNPKDIVTGSVLGGLAGGGVSSFRNRNSDAPEAERKKDFWKSVAVGSGVGGVGMSVGMDRVRRMLKHNIHPFGYGGDVLPKLKAKDFWHGAVMDRPTPGTLEDALRRYHKDPADVSKLPQEWQKFRGRTFKDPLRTASALGLIDPMEPGSPRARLAALDSRRELLGRWIGQHHEDPRRDYFVNTPGGRIEHNPQNLARSSLGRFLLTPRMDTLSAMKAEDVRRPLHYTPMGVKDEKGQGTNPLNFVWGSHGFDEVPGSYRQEGNKHVIDRQLRDAWDFKLDTPEKAELAAYGGKFLRTPPTKWPSLLRSPQEQSWDPDSHGGNVAGRLQQLGQRQVFEGLMGHQVPLINQRFRLTYGGLNPIYARNPEITPLSSAKVGPSATRPVAPPG